MAVRCNGGAENLRKSSCLSSQLSLRAVDSCPFVMCRMKSCRLPIAVLVFRLQVIEDWPVAFAFDAGFNKLCKITKCTRQAFPLYTRQAVKFSRCWITPTASSICLIQVFLEGALRLGLLFTSSHGVKKTYRTASAYVICHQFCLFRCQMNFRSYD